MRCAVISRCCSCKRGRREWGLLVALSTIILSNVIHTSLPPHVAIPPFYSTFNLQFCFLNALFFSISLGLPSLYFHLKRIRLPSHNVSIYPQGSSAAITVSFGNYKFKVQLCCKSLLERDPAIEKSFRVLAITVTLGNYDSVDCKFLSERVKEIGKMLSSCNKCLTGKATA